MESTPPQLVGRARERAAIAAALDALHAGTGGILELRGEPGIGKSRLLAHLAAHAGATACTVLEARASEYEEDLPYALWTEALDRHLAAAGAHRLARLGLADPGLLAAALPALAELAQGEPAPADRHRTHRAMRDLLERLAATRPLVVCLDDVHWADPASGDVLAALVHRPPRAPVLLAVAGRTGRLPATLATALAGALSEQRLTLLDPGALSPDEAGELVGPAAAAIYATAGGNPFYLEQLARVHVPGVAGPSIAPDGSVPAAVAAALAAELAALAPAARRMLDAAAVVGDPFESGLAADVAELPEAEALDALDVLLAHALARPAGAPRQFAFRHPVVRHAVYVASPRAWRLGAHARAARALERRGADLVERGRHVAESAAPGDEQAIALLTAAARQLQSPAPASAARFLAAALRLLPDSAGQREQRVRIRVSLADARAAAGDAEGACETLLAALEEAAGDERLALTVALANAEWALGRDDAALTRLHVALGELPAEPSPDRIRLRLALGFTALMTGDLDESRAQASDAGDDARSIGDPVFEFAALSAAVLARVAQADMRAGGAGVDDLSAAMRRLSREQLATRLPAFWMLGRARRGLGRFDAALADIERGAAIATDTGRENMLAYFSVESAADLIELGRLAEAGAAAQQGLERARVGRNPRTLLWAQSTLASARLAAGDVAAALRLAELAAENPPRADIMATAQPGWCLGAALTAAGNHERAVRVLLEAFGGATLEHVLPIDRPAAAADLVEAQLACGDVAAAEQSLAPAEAAAARAGTAWAAAVTGTARAGVMLAQGRAGEAAAVGAAAREAAAGAPLARARAQLAEGRALAADGRRKPALEALIAAESALDGFGALRRRDEAVRELRRLGHRVLRQARAGGGDGLAGLTAREREIAALVAAGRTNREVAEQLVLSARTIDAHLRNVYGKLGVRSRVELARAVERAGGQP